MEKRNDVDQENDKGIDSLFDGVQSKRRRYERKGNDEDDYIRSTKKHIMLPYCKKIDLYKNKN